MSLTEPLYVSNPSGRGTLSLLFSSVSTLFLCAWTAIHLNIFRVGTAWWTRLKCKMILSVICIVAPEVIIFRALVQFMDVRSLCGDRKKLLESDIEREQATDKTTNSLLSHSHCPVSVRQKRGDKPRDRQWTMEHGYFAIMGGVCVNVRDELIVTDKGEECTTLTPSGILLLTKYDLMPDLSTTTIRARSKADSLSKLLICIQVSWMLIQTIARKFYGLPVTLLEINTLGQITCAL